MHRHPLRAARAVAIVGAVALGLAVVAAAPASAASEWDLDYSGPDATVRSFGHGSATMTYGQTFTVPEGPEELESFSLAMNLPATAVFRVVVQAWDNTNGHATGPVLYTSGPMSTAGTGMETLTFTPGIPVTAGMYVLYATTVYDPAAGTGTGSWAADPGNPYADGAFVYDHVTEGAEALTARSWSGLASHAQYDIGFTVVYAAPVVPPVTPPAAPATPAIRPPAYTG